MAHLGSLFRKEMLESWRTYRLPVVTGLFLIVGLSSPLLARYLPEIIEIAAGDQLGGAVAIPTPTGADAVDAKTASRTGRTRSKRSIGACLSDGRSSSNRRNETGSATVTPRASVER